MSRLPWITGICLLVLTILGAAWAISSTGPSAGKHKPEQPPLVVIFGKVDGEYGIIPIVPVTAGEIMDVLDERAMVEENQILLKMDPEIARLRLEDAECDLKSSQAQLDKAKQGLKLLDNKKEQQKYAVANAEKERIAKKAELDLNLKRSQDIGNKIDAFLKTQLEADVDRLEIRVKAENEKLKELDLIKNDVESEIIRAKAEVASKKIQKEKAKYGLDKCDVKAPYRGMVLQVNVKKGQVLTGQERMPPIQFLPMPLKKGADPKSITYYVKGEVIQEWASRVKLGMVVEVQDDAYQGEKFEGKITRLSPWMAPKRQIVFEPFMVNDQNTQECTVEVTSKIKSDNSRVPLNLDDMLVGQRVRIVVYPEKS